MPDRFWVGPSMSLVESGDVFVFVGLRHKGEEMADAMKRSGEFPLKMVTIFSISTSGELCYRVDDVEDEDTAMGVLNGVLPEVTSDKVKLFSLPYSDALALIDQHIWVQPRQNLINI